MFKYILKKVGYKPTLPLTIIDSSVTITNINGNSGIQSENDLFIEGHLIVDSIKCNTLTLGINAILECDSIEVNVLINQGKIIGNITVSNRFENTGLLTGNCKMCLQ